MEWMTLLGVVLLVAGFICWFVGMKQVVAQAHKRLGIEQREFPFAPFSIPFGKFNKQEWRNVIILFLLCTALFNVATACFRQ